MRSLASAPDTCATPRATSCAICHRTVLDVVQNEDFQRHVRSIKPTYYIAPNAKDGGPKPNPHRDLERIVTLEFLDAPSMQIAGLTFTSLLSIIPIVRREHGDHRVPVFGEMISALKIFSSKHEALGGSYRELHAEFTERGQADAVGIFSSS